jgi:formate hydrogenlyase subunit 6/NADH:ubiquinone oxidoreductase subunit I
VNALGELPDLNEARCTGCGDCVAVCPTNCLAMARHHPWLPRPGDCIACGACEVVCPTEAIAIQTIEAVVE